MPKKKILLVEDEEAMVYAVKLQLEQSGYEVIAAYDGQEGFRKVKREKPDLIILDLMLPKMDGYKVCGLLKADRRYKKIPVIMFTARAQESDVQMGKEVGTDAYFTKPFDPETLLKKIRGLLKE